MKKLIEIVNEFHETNNGDQLLCVSRGDLRQPELPEGYHIFFILTPRQHERIPGERMLILEQGTLACIVEKQGVIMFQFDFSDDMLASENWEVIPTPSYLG